MGDYTATRAHVYTTGAVIYAANHNNNENEIYNKHNSAINASTGHTHTGGTGDGPKLNSTGLDMTASYTWTGTHTFNNNVTIGTDKKLYFRDTNAYLYSSSATDMAWYVDANLFLTLGNSAGTRFIQASQNVLLNSNKLGLDGVAASTNYLQYTGGAYVTYLDSNLYLTMGNSAGNRFIQASQNVLLAANKLITSSSATGTTYIQEASSNILDVYVNGYPAAQFDHSTGGALAINHQTSATTGQIKQFYKNSNNSVYFEQDYLFTSGDVYWALQSNSKTPLVWSDTNDVLRLQTTVGLQATRKFYWDANTGSGTLTTDTYTTETSANRLDTYVGGVLTLHLDRTANVFSIDAGGSYSWNTSGDITARSGVFAMGAASGADTAAVDVSGANAGAGAARGLHFSTLGGTLDQVMQFNAAYQDGTARTYTNVNIPVYLDGVGIRYIPIYN